MSNFNKIPKLDLAVSSVIIILVSTFVGKIYNPIWGISYMFANILFLTLLNWLYGDLKGWNGND